MEDLNRKQVIQKIVINYMSNWKGYENFFNNWIDKKIFFFLKKKSNLFSQTLKKTNKNKIEIDLDLYIYATKTDSKNAAGVDTLC